MTSSPLAGRYDEAPILAAESNMQGYDPLVVPDAAEWLDLGEHERISLVTDYHRRARIEVPQMQLHCLFHTIIENQIALGEAPVERALQRLMADGLDRHDAIHAVGSVLAPFLLNLMQGTEAGAEPNKSYYEALDRLTMDEWRRLA
jgi:hypothetical protein